MAFHKHHVIALLAFTGFFCFWGTDAWAASASYTIDQSLSHISVVPSTFDPNSFDVIAGTKFLDTFGIYEQKPGSLDSKISGILTADVTGNTVSFLGPNLIDAKLNAAAPFLPHPPGSPGVEDDFGAYAQTAGFNAGEVAVRDTVASLASGSATIGQPVTGLNFYLTSATLDYHLPLIALAGYPPLDYYDLAPSIIVSNQSTGNFTGTANGTIHIPFHLEFPYAVADGSTIDSLLVLDGEIVANRVATSLTGDYNGNGVVDAADYVFWRNSVGTTATLPNDPIGGVIGSAQYSQWRGNFGKTPGLGTSLALVPEPATFYLILTLTLVACGLRNDKAKARSNNLLS